MRDSDGYDSRYRRRFGRMVGGVLAALAVVVAAGACTDGSRGAAPQAQPSAAKPAAVASPTTKMICEGEVQGELEAALGRTTVRPVVPTWAGGVYSCTYAYSEGSFTLSVKQLPDSASTQLFFAHEAAALGRSGRLDGLGQGAFSTTSGSVVVQKDDKVLVADVRKLPAQFGTPSDSRANVAITITATIMGCWTGA